jgi:hypothetical protein
MICSLWILIWKPCFFIEFYESDRLGLFKGILRIKMGGGGGSTSSWIASSVAGPDPGSGVFLTPGSGMGKNRIRIRDTYPGRTTRIISDSLKPIFELKYLNYLMRIRDPGWKKFGSGMENIRIRDPE